MPPAESFSAGGILPARDSAPVLAAIGVGKVFGPVTVISDIDFSVQAGEVHGLLGENGAGKSTLLKILQGVHRPDSGHLEVGGREISFPTVAAARAAGVGMIFQEFSLIPELTVGQNVFLNRERRNRLGLVDDRSSNSRTAEIFRDLEVDIDPKALVGSLSTAQWQLVEIAKAISINPKVLIMDEPTASLAEHEVSLLFSLIERLKSRGIGIVYVSHRMKEIFDVCDRVTVLRDGHLVATKPTAETDLNEIISFIVGRELGAAMEFRDRSNLIGDVDRLVVRDLSVGPLRDVSFTVRAGEIVGIAGLMGSGRTELLECIFGIRRHSTGTLELDGKLLSARSSRKSIDAGLALVPEDRRRQGLVLESSIRDNVALPSWHKLTSGGLLSASKSRALATTVIEDLAVRASSDTQEVRQLSGGNQQKVVLGKWLATTPLVLLLDEPTAGVDIGSKGEIVETVRAAADSGVSVIVASSELAELLALSDRVVVLRNGRAEFDLPRSAIVDDEHLQRLIHLGLPSSDSEQS